MKKKIVVTFIVLLSSFILAIGMASVTTASSNGGTSKGHNDMNMTDIEMQNMDSDQENVSQSSYDDKNSNAGKKESVKNSNMSSQREETAKDSGMSSHEEESENNSNRALPVSFFFGFITLVITFAAVTRPKQSAAKKGVN